MIFKQGQTGKRSQELQSLLAENNGLRLQQHILEVQIQEKAKRIDQLKEEIDATTLEDTRNRLHFLRIMEEEVDSKAAEARKEYLGRIIELERIVEQNRIDRETIEDKLVQETQRSNGLKSRLEFFKGYMLEVEEKDSIIGQLSEMVNELSLQRPSQTSNLECPSKRKEAGLGTRSIRRQARGVIRINL